MSDLAVQEFFGDFETGSDAIGYSGTIGMSAKTVNRHGEPVEIGYDVDVEAVADFGWETDEQPTGWNYRTDGPTYTSSMYASVSEPVISSISFTPDQEFYIDNEVYSLYDAQRVIDPAVLKQLLNPQIYIPLMRPSFEKKAEDMEPPEQYYDDYDDYDDYDMRGDY